MGKRKSAFLLKPILWMSLACSVACASYSEKTEALREVVQAGDLEGGVRETNRLLEVKQQDALPKKWKKNTALTLLERATLFHALGLYELSAEQFSLAERELEFLDLARDVGGKIGQYVYSDSSTKYKLSPTEKLSLNTLNLINYLAIGDLDGAAVEAKRFTVMQNYLKDYDPDHAYSAVGSYLAGFVFEKLGRDDTALRYYSEALESREVKVLDAPIRRLAQRSTFRNETLSQFLENGGSSGGSGRDASESSAEVLLVLELGRVPYKVARRVPVGAAIGLAHTYITGDPTVLEHSAMKFVVYPELEPSGSLYSDAHVWVDDVAIPVEEVSDFGAEIVHEYEDIRARIVGSALTRMIVRAAAAEGARAAGKQAEKGGEVVGLLAALAVEGSLVALDRPDTRSWSLLPANILIGRIALPPGNHEFVVEVRSQSGQSERRHYNVELQPGGFAVVNLATLR